MSGTDVVTFKTFTTADDVKNKHWYGKGDLNFCRNEIRKNFKRRRLVAEKAAYNEQ